jgi:diadenosine tetraphosphate (Ap4A) HIT family hydrolase
MPEPSVFSRVISGEFPGRFVHRDPNVVAFLSIAPIQPGHTLVVTVEQIDHWTDVPPDLWAKVSAVSQQIARAQLAAFGTARVGSMLLGMEVPHCHVHLVPINHESDLSFANADAHAAPEAMDEAAERIRAELRAMGHEGVAD